jgi:outer membrane lipoprotein-sorting protein
MRPRNRKTELDNTGPLPLDGVPDLFDGLEDQPAEQQALEAHLRMAELQATRVALARIHQAERERFIETLHAQARPAGGRRYRWEWITTMCRTKTFQTVGAAALVCVGVGVWLALASGPTSQAAYAAAYSHMVDKLQAAESVTWVQTDRANSTEAASTTYYVDNQGHMRYERESPRGPTYDIENLITRDWYKFYPFAKTVVLRKSLAQDVTAASLLDTVRGFVGETGAYTGQETIEGIECYVYACGEHGSVIYMNAGSNLPVRIRFESGGDTTEFSRIEWNNVDPAVFEIEIPEGWTLHDERSHP